ncbi:MAG: DNA double-strand break repair nuclease NurA [Clostridiales bacterium]|nr:DNA double-strand break repair nuclease NurA [Clostridiales bacterium]
MLDLGKLGIQLADMALQRKQDIQSYNQKEAAALKALDEYRKNFSRFMEKINSDSRHFFVAFPQGRIDDAFPLPGSFASHTVMAVDGSQIDVDTHEIVLCYVINIGRVVLHYGTGEPPLMDSLPFLFYKDEDLYVQGNGENFLVQGEDLAEKRSRMEARQLNELLINHCRDGSPAVALLDGTLASWDRAGSAKKDIGGFTAPNYVDVFETGERLGIPVAGYISGSRTALVINTLRAGDCTQPVMNCVSCEYRNEPKAPCREMEGLRDTALFKDILNPGERSVCFYGGINILPKHEWPPYRIGFFYINVGSEIARVEAPDYVLENRELLDRLHWVVYNQAQKGMGYPVALQEAHHFAVVRGEEREAFFRLVEGQFIRHGLPCRVTSKELRKRTRIF